MGTDSRVWDGSYEPTQAELEEPVTLPPSAQDLPFDEAAGRIMSVPPPADASWPDDG